MTTQVERKLFTVKEYYQMALSGILAPDDRVELINGIIYKISPINSMHAGTVNFLVKLLNDQIGDLASICSQNPLAINHASEPEPDILIARFRADYYRANHPKPEDVYCIIEVADSSLEYDQGTKKDLYAAANIPEYWIVNLPKKQVEIYQSPQSGKYQEMEILKTPRLAKGQSILFEVDLSTLF